MNVETFWWALTLAALAWYSSVTLYVAVRGAGDIREMLARLSARQPPDSHAQDPQAPHEGPPP